MQRPLWRSYLESWVTIGVVLSVAVSAAAQTVTRGRVTDEWDNGLDGVTVLAEPVEVGTSQATTTTDEDGRFQFTALATGYHGLRVFNPVLDSLGLSAEPVFFEVSPGEVTSARLRFRSLDTVSAERCPPADSSPYEGILTGFALDEKGDISRGFEYFRAVFIFTCEFILGGKL